MNVRTCFLCLRPFLLYLAANLCSIFISVKGFCKVREVSLFLLKSENEQKWERIKGLLRDLSC